MERSEEDLQMTANHQSVTFERLNIDISERWVLAYGNVDARLSYGGNALLTYPRLVEEGDGPVYTRNWVVAKPFGYSGVARVAITLRVPEGQQTTPEIQALMDELDKQVGDAVIPSV
jgi:hypothetical protein